MDPVAILAILKTAAAIFFIGAAILIMWAFDMAPSLLNKCKSLVDFLKEILREKKVVACSLLFGVFCVTPYFPKTEPGYLFILYGVISILLGLAGLFEERLSEGFAVLKKEGLGGLLTYLTAPGESHSLAADESFIPSVIASSVLLCHT